MECSSKDLHSGIHGGVIYEAMNDLIYLMSNLVTKEGKILIPGVCDSVRVLPHCCHHTIYMFMFYILHDVTGGSSY